MVTFMNYGCWPVPFAMCSFFQFCSHKEGRPASSSSSSSSQNTFEAHADFCCFFTLLPIATSFPDVVAVSELNAQARKHARLIE